MTYSTSRKNRKRNKVFKCFGQYEGGFLLQSRVTCHCINTATQSFKDERS